MILPQDLTHSKELNSSRNYEEQRAKALREALKFQPVDDQEHQEQGMKVKSCKLVTNSLV